MRVSTELQSRRAGLPHAVFLQRVADEPATSPDVRLGQGAFLTLRFVDLLAPDREPPTPDVFRYQWAATERYCAELAGERSEEHTSELQSPCNLVCRLLLEKKKKKTKQYLALDKQQQ